VIQAAQGLEASAARARSVVWLGHFGRTLPSAITKKASTWTGGRSSPRAAEALGEVHRRRLKLPKDVTAHLKVVISKEAGRE